MRCVKTHQFMKIRIWRSSLSVMVSIALAMLCARVVSAADPEKSTASGSQAPAYVTQMLADVVKMSEAGVGADVMRNYVDSARSASKLSPEEIVYARDRGVPNDIVAAIIRKSSQPDTTAQAPAPVAVSTRPAYVAPAQPVATAYVQPSVVYVLPAPVYVAPPVVTYGYGYGCGYGFQPRYYAQAYGYYPWPRVSVGVGFRHGGVRVGF